jgi:hypothetical protein
MQILLAALVAGPFVLASVAEAEGAPSTPSTRRPAQFSGRRDMRTSSISKIDHCNSRMEG